MLETVEGTYPATTNSWRLEHFPLGLSLIRGNWAGLIHNVGGVAGFVTVRAFADVESGAMGQIVNRRRSVGVLLREAAI